MQPEAGLAVVVGGPVTWEEAGEAVGAAAEKVASCHAREASQAAPSRETSGGAAWPTLASATPPPTPATDFEDACSPWPGVLSANTSNTPPRWCNQPCDAPAGNSGSRAPPSPATERPSQWHPHRSEPRYGVSNISLSKAWAAPKPGDPALWPAPPAGPPSSAPGAARRSLPMKRKKGQARRHARCAAATPMRPTRSPPSPSGERSPGDERRWSPWSRAGGGGEGRRRRGAAAATARETYLGPKRALALTYLGDGHASRIVIVSCYLFNLVFVFVLFVAGRCSLCMHERGTWQFFIVNYLN
jgi:hypothetical protein